jgi:hypothetical protein
MTKEEAITTAQAIFNRYPEATTANEAVDLSRADGYFKDETEMLAVWGRLMRLYRKVGA